MVMEILSGTINDSWDMLQMTKYDWGPPDLSAIIEVLKHSWCMGHLCRLPSILQMIFSHVTSAVEQARSNAHVSQDQAYQLKKKKKKNFVS